MVKGKTILVKGAGDFASGTIRRLHLAGAKVVCTELEKPLTIRRKVAFSSAIYACEQEVDVEDVLGVKAEIYNFDKYWLEGKVPVVIDPDSRIQKSREFDIVVDARSAKKNLGTTTDEAPIVIGLGPGFVAGIDCHAVVETLAGHNLGRVIYEGSAAENTNEPIPMANTVCCSGFTPFCSGFDVNTLLLRAPGDGIFYSNKKIGSMVEIGDIVGRVDDFELIAESQGVLRGLIHDGVKVTKGLKLGDIDPSGDKNRVYQISEKANAIAGGVLEACLYLLNKNEI